VSYDPTSFQMRLESGGRGPSGTDLDSLVSSVVVHHRMQSVLEVGLGKLSAEGQELLLPMPWLDRGGYCRRWQRPQNRVLWEPSVPTPMI
jgi:hypothetical protein